MIDLTVIILTKNEEKNIEKCIKSFRDIAKKFIVVDSFSTDNTKEVCQNINTKTPIEFVENKFVDHSTQMNWALDNVKINSEWIMRIDADEELTFELAKEIVERLPLLEEGINGVFLKRRVYFMGKWIKYGGVYPTKLLRIFRRDTARCEQKLMDEHMILQNGNTIEFKNDFIDNNNNKLEWWIEKHNWYSGKEVLEHFRKNSELQSELYVKANFWGNQAERKRWIKDVIYYRTPLLKRAKYYFIYRYFLKFGFLDGKEGLIFHFLQGYWYRFLVDAKIHEKKRIEELKK